MSNYKAYTHIERLDSPDCEGILDGTCYVQAKVDSTNACVWFEDGAMHAGSRKREVTPEKDNAGFAVWVTADAPEQNALRKLCEDNPDWIVYGEFMGIAKFLGQIKDYNSDAKNHMYIFDVYSQSLGRYIDEILWRPVLEQYGLVEWIVPTLAVIENPTVDQIAEIAQNNKFLLDNAAHVGEGVVVKNYNFINKYGHFCYGKLVLDEYKQAKKISKKAVLSPGEMEKTIVDTYVTDSELAKAREKVVVACNADEFDTKNPKMIGMYVNSVWSDLCQCCAAWCKRYKNPIVDFSKLKGICQEKARKYVGL